MEGDLDNIVKPILDALSRHVYMDDRQIEPVLYIRLSDDPYEGLI
jgi:crossover junction endodeoxyribonuclease RusA